MDLDDYLGFGMFLLQAFLFVGIPLISIGLLKYFWDTRKEKKEAIERKQKFLDEKIELEKVNKK